MLVDTHCHLDFDKFQDDIDAVIQRAVDAGVRKMIIPAVDLEQIPAVLKLAEKYQWLYAAVGIHPNSTANLPPDWLTQIRGYAKHYKVIAIGEIGLDYYWDASPKPMQQEAFEAQLELADELDLPVIIHNREATADTLDILRWADISQSDKPGVLHSFAGDWEAAVEAIDLGYFLGFTGPVTYKKNIETQRIAREMPIDRLLVETDAPFLTPIPKRGERNEPAYVRYVADFIAGLRGLSPEIFEDLTTENCACLFGRDIIYR